MHKLIVFVGLFLGALGTVGQQLNRAQTKKSDSLANAYKFYPISDPEKLARELTKNSVDEISKFRSIYKWVTDNISYDVDLYLRNEVNNKKYKHDRLKLMRWRKKYSSLALRTLFKHRKSTCLGYSYLLSKMCSAVGISNEIIEGYGRTIDNPWKPRNLNHAWNAIKIDGMWYLSDPTWGSGYVDSKSKKFVREFSDRYFLSRPDRFANDHFPKMQNWFLTTEKPTIEEFYDSPIKLAGFFDQKINNIYPLKGQLKVRLDSSLTFRFTANTEIKFIGLTEVNDEYQYSYDHKVHQADDGYYEFAQPFRKKGISRAFIYVNRIAVLVYEVSVSK